PIGEPLRRGAAVFRRLRLGGGEAAQAVAVRQAPESDDRAAMALRELAALMEEASLIGQGARGPVARRLVLVPLGRRVGVEEPSGAPEPHAESAKIGRASAG